MLPGGAGDYPLPNSGFVPSRSPRRVNGNLHYVPNVKPALILLVNGTDAEVQEEVKQVLEENTSWYKIKSRNVSASGMDMIVELKTKQEDILTQKILAVSGVENATLMTHDGEVTY